MKTLKFKDNLVQLIKSGEKTSTWRLFDEKDLQLGDELCLMNKDSGQEFAFAKIISVIQKNLGEINDNDYSGHEKFASREAMYETYRTYYGDQVNDDTQVKMIKFQIVLFLGKYRHYKGQEYEVISLAKHSETLEELVIYRALYGNHELWARPLAMFCEKINIDGKNIPRFLYIE